MKRARGRFLAVVIPFLAACGADNLGAGQQSSALACSGVVSGAFTGQLGASTWPKALSYFEPTDQKPIMLACQQDNHMTHAGPELYIWVPRTVGPFTNAPATFYSNPPEGGSDPTYRGTCSGIVTQVATAVGDQVRATYSCASLTGLGDTPASAAISVSDGAFDIQVRRTPPE